MQIDKDKNIRMNTISLSIEKGKKISGHFVGETTRQSEDN
jgi:hypothetical protein